MKIMKKETALLKRCDFLVGLPELAFLNFFTSSMGKIQTYTKLRDRRI